MKPIESLEELRAEIKRLEQKSAEEEAEIKVLFRKTTERLKPSTMIKNATSELASSAEFKGNVGTIIMSMFAGWLSKRVTFGDNPKGPAKNILSSLLQSGVTNLVAKNADFLKSKGWGLLQGILRRRNKSQEEEDEPDTSGMTKSNTNSTIYTGD